VSCTLYERLFVADSCRLLLDKGELLLGSREDLFDAVDERGNAVDEVFELGAMVKSLAAHLQHTGTFLSSKC
jgi:hypothetical protein